MSKRNRWLLLIPLVLMCWGQFSYACQTMDMPPQAVCCCEDGMASGDTAGCDLDAGSDPCCVVEYESAAEDVVPTSLSADPTLAWLNTIALVHWPYLDPLSTQFLANTPPNPDWLLAQAESGRTVYLSTLRLRI